MAEQKLFEKVREILSNEGFLVFSFEAGGPEGVTLDTNLRDDLEMDSLDLVEFVMALEELFEIELPDEEVEKHLWLKWGTATVRDAVELVRRHTEAKEGQDG